VIIPPDRAEIPWFGGMEEECAHEFKLWFRAASNPRYYELTSPDQIERRSVDDLTVEEFIEKYEKPGLPVIISGIARDWPATQNWTKEKLLERHGETKFRTGSGFKMTLKKYFDYLSKQHEMQPLYLFDQNYPFRAKPMGTEYKIPDYFPEDLFEIVGEDDRPPYRWILVGPSGSGVPYHTDPRGTSAWNTVLSGKKRWALYPPSIHPPGVGPNHADYYDAPTAIKWYHKYAPTLKPEHMPMEGLQNEGETIFIPSQWWHMVYNVGLQGSAVIAVTQNYASTQNFHQVLPTLFEDKADKFTPVFKKKLAASSPTLYARFLQAQADLGAVDSISSSESSQESSDSVPSESSSEEGA